MNFYSNYLSLNLSFTRHSGTEDILPISDASDKIERLRLTSFIQQQTKEIEALRTEITILKRKDIPPIALTSTSLSLPNPPNATVPEYFDGQISDDLVLPPIRKNSFRK